MYLDKLSYFIKML